MSSVMATIEVNVPVQTAYNQFTQFEEFPHFMEGVEQVRQIDDEHLHWTASIGGQRVEWTAEITEQIPDKRIAWRSTSGAPNAGVVTFHHLAKDCAKVTLQMDYEPESWSESLGDLLGFLSRRVEGDLRHFKQFIEDRGHETGAWRGEVKLDEDKQPRGATRGGGESPHDKAGESHGQRYNSEAREFAATDKGERAAAEAKRAVEGPEGAELRRAERVGREPARNERY